MWSIPLPTNITGGGTFNPLMIKYADSGVVLMYSSSPSGYTDWNSGWEIEAGYNWNTGQQLWITNRTTTPWAHMGLAGQGSCAGLGFYAIVNYETGGWYVYSMTTGQQLWGPAVSPAFSDWDTESAYAAVFAYGELITVGFGGDITGFNVTNGNVLWTWTTSDSGLETAYGNYPLWVGFNLDPTVAGGEVLIGGGHEYNPPMFQGSQLWVVNATTGKTVWSILGFDTETAAAVSDGVMVDYDSYDCQIYAYGMGPTAMTVTAPDVGVTTATPITIRGTITDISAGTKQEAQAANFPDGLPCVSDASQSAWMEYVYMQQPMPTNTTGVPIAINVVDSNGNSRQIGTTTSKADGTFSLNWTPDISGAYTVTASFAGSESYYPSSAGTSFYASSASSTLAPTAAPLTDVATNTSLMTFMAIGVIAIIIAIAVVGLLLLRKHA
jgi:hypothetical protein